ncbi:transcriptional regulator, TetR family [Lentzea xinjiangensis]|uniref:Transcriptional regulator, TetR family n=1 Tax=Lentzea xinjiangensis TaxID=402600 RepID=A0A1H9MIQ3_9PSEU|nr:TetR/AcrR family transcriptional regulator [Lentzea xinjiangensis]SER23409.1 transcriptional regulator, TetR family [Lentzea xinjiangensis]
MTRSYHSPRRAQDAATTRRDILRAAVELFSANGYARVTVADIAKRAGVAPQTVYSSAGSKSEILHRIIGEAVAHSDSATTTEAVRQTHDLAEALRLLAKGTRQGNEGGQQVVEVLFASIPVHEDGAALWEQSTGAYREALREVAHHLRDEGLLGMDVERATDVLWFCFGFGAWRTLVKECGWSWDDAERWLAAQAITMFSR